MMSKNLLQSHERFLRVPVICAGIAAGTALLALAGWLSGVRFLAGQWADYVPMAPSTAFAFLLLSGALFCFARLPTSRLSRLFTLTAVSIVFLLGLLVLVQFIAGIDLGLEQVLSRTNEYLGSTPLGRMSPLTAISFMLEGTALFLLTAERGRNAPTAAGLLAAGATGINAVVLIGYAFGAPLLYGGTIIPTALPTAIAFVLVGVGQFYLAVPGVPALRDWSGASMRGILLRAFLPFMLFFVLVQGWFDLTIQPVLSLNPAVWQSLMALIASVLIVLVIGWIARRTGSEIERAQETLAESEERYRRLFEAAKDGILILDAGTGEIVDVNPFLIELLGYSHTEFLGKQLWKIGLFKDIVANKSAFLKLQEQRYVRYENLPLETKDGRSIWVEFVSNVYEAGDTRVVQCNIRNITERKRAEEMLKESEERFQNAFEYAAIGKALVAPNGRWIRVNRALVEMLGYSREELLTMTFQDITHPDDLETDLVYVRQMLAGEIQTYQMEKRYLHKQGRVVCALLSVSLVRGKENEPLHFISQIQDITERRQAVEALQKSEEQYRALAEGSPDMIFVIDRDDRVQYVNTFAARQAGTTPENVIGKPRTDLFPPDIAAQQEQSLQRVFESGVPLVSESPLRFGEREMWISNRLVPLRDKLGKVTAVLGVSRDITERKRAEDEIRHLNKFNENLINNMSEGIVVQNTDGEFTFVNPAVSSITGYPPEELIGEHWTKFIPADQHEIIKEADNRRLAGQASQYEIDFLHKSGKRINQLVSGSPLFENECFNGSMAVFTNITERKRVEEAERDQRTLAEALRDTAETLNRTLGFGEVLDHILVSVGRVVPHDSATILMIEEGVLRVARSQGYAERGLPVEQFVSELSLTETTNLRQMFETGKPVLISDTRAYASWVQVPETSWLRSNLGAPMSIHEEIVGFILLDSGTPDFFTSVHAENLQAFANQAALAIYNARLYQHAQEEITARKQAQEKLRIQLERLSALREIDQTIASTFDLSLSLNTLIAHTTRLLDVDAVSVLLLNSAFNRLEYSAGRGFKSAAIKTTNIKLGESYAGRAVIERRIVEIPNMGDEPNGLFKKGFMKDEKFVSYYGAPLIVKGKVVGVLEVFHRSLVDRDLEWHEFFSAMAGQAAIAIENAKLFENLQVSNSDLFQAYDATIEGWSRALDLRDKETEGHSLRVTAKTLELAHIMGLSGDQLVNIRRGALLHDIGKMGVPDHILLKAEDLTEDEWKIMRKHPTFAFELLSPIRYLKSAAIDIPYCHHEKWDGTGYPRGLKGEQIPLAARIFAVLDSWDALTSVRPYRPAWSKEKALAHIRSLAGTHFDPNVVKAFLESDLH